MNGKSGIATPRLAAVLDRLRSASPDVVLLQEVHAGTAAAQMADGLADLGLAYCVCSATPSTAKPYGNVIASRWPVRTTPWVTPSPWPQLIARAEIEVDEIPVDVLNVHIPNGSANGWKKIETFESLASYLNAAPDAPRVVAGDFNEPRDVLPTGEVVTFGQRPRKDGTYTTAGMWRRQGESRPRAEWDAGVRSVLDGTDAHGLRLAYLEVPGWTKPVTHVTRANNRFFDHLLISRHFAVRDAGYYDDWRTSKASDHSALWAELELLVV